MLLDSRVWSHLSLNILAAAAPYSPTAWCTLDIQAAMGMAPWLTIRKVETDSNQISTVDFSGHREIRISVDSMQG